MRICVLTYNAVNMVRVQFIRNAKLSDKKLKFSSDFLANEFIVGTRQYSYILCGCNVTMGN